MHFYGSIQGNRGEATRGGSAQSGITAHPRGWNVGVRVDGHVLGVQDEADDTFDVRITGGSNDGWRSQHLARVFRDVATGGWLVELTRPDGTTETLTYA